MTSRSNDVWYVNVDLPTSGVRMVEAMTTAEYSISRMISVVGIWGIGFLCGKAACDDSKAKRRSGKLIDPMAIQPEQADSYAITKTRTGIELPLHDYHLVSLSITGKRLPGYSFSSPLIRQGITYA